MENSKIISVEIIFNKFKKLVKETLRMDDGKEIDWVYLDTPKSVIIIPITDDGEVIMIRQYRYNLKQKIRSYTN